MEQNRHAQHGGEHHYARLAGMVLLSFISMYVLMYSMVHSVADVYSSFNQVYMAGLMTAPMVVIELLLMSGMYKNKRLNALIITGSCVAGIAFFMFIRQQTAISDRQFLRLDDPSPLRSNPDVRGRLHSGPANQGTLQDDHLGTTV